MNAYIHKKTGQLLAMAYGVEWPKGTNTDNIATVEVDDSQVALLAAMPKGATVDPNTLEITLPKVQNPE